MEALRNTQETQLREVVQLLKTKSTSSEPQVLYEWCRYWNYSWIKTYSISDIHIVYSNMIFTSLVSSSSDIAASHVVCMCNYGTPYGLWATS